MTSKQALENPRQFLNDCLLNPDARHPASVETVDLINREVLRLTNAAETLSRVRDRLEKEIKP